MSEKPESPTISKTEHNKRIAARKKRQQRKKIRTGIIALLVLTILIIGIVLICKSCSADNSIVGIWDYDTVTVYRFEKGGKGALELPNGSYEFTYKTDGDKLTIDFISESAIDNTYTFHINDDALTLISDSNSYVLKKVE